MSEEKLSKKELRAQKHAEKAERKAEEARKAKRESLVQNVFVWGLVAVLGAGLVLFVGNVLTSEDRGAVVEFNIPVAESDWIKGNPEAEVTVVEYADFQCPHCRTAVSVVDSLLASYGDSVRVVYRHFPLPMFNNSFKAARAAEAAGEQGKFFEMHDLLFENQSEWAPLGNPDETFSGYATELGLDMIAFSEAYGSKEVEDRIAAERDGAREYAVLGTPTFFVNGKSVASSELALSQAIQAELAALSTSTVDVEVDTTPDENAEGTE